MKPNFTDPSDFSFSPTPSAYRHIELTVDKDEAVIGLKVDPTGGLRADTQLKLNSYDLSVDIELNDAINRLRFEHPQVRVLTFLSKHPQVFSSGANIYMLKKSSHAFKVNFCKFTNETRLYLEEASQFSGLKSLAALNGTAAGGGYELALATDHILLLDDKAAAVSLPEVPLLGVLPGTGGLTRLVDKRHVRRDLADTFAGLVEGIKGKKAVEWGLVDEVASKTQWDDSVKNSVAKLKDLTPAKSAVGISWGPITPDLQADGFFYQYVKVDLKEERAAQVTILGPREPQPRDVEGMAQQGSKLWLIQAFRELDDALLRLRFFHRDRGLLEFKTQGDLAQVLAAEAPLYQAQNHWLTREIFLLVSRVLRRLDTTSRTILTAIEPGSCFAGVLAEIFLASDRSFGLVTANETQIALSPINVKLLMWNDRTRLEQRFYGQKLPIARAFEHSLGTPIGVLRAGDLGLITAALDEIDYHDELRVFKEERKSMSPDALTAMESNLRWAGSETLATKILGRLTAWQNWVFTRDNATGVTGALSAYGEDLRAQFDWERC
jgi:benzoyl-CoA-dihydrodiol lyase